MSAHQAAQFVPSPFHSTDAVVWGDRNDDTDLMPIVCRAGLLFTLDMRSGRAFDAGEEMCYFIGAEDWGHVKIGKSAHVKNRLRALQLSSPVRLKILALAKGGGATEAAYHAKFAEDRAWGEWFYRSRKIEREIAKLAKQISEAESLRNNVEYEIGEGGEIARLTQERGV